jgi:outer membrane receptor protein involved in Fe transport
MYSVRHAVSLVVGTLAVAATHAPLAHAQGATGTADSELEEVVVTATRLSDSVNRVALSVTAQTQQALDQQGIRDISDLVATVPSLRLNGREASGNVNVAIRSVRQQSGTAATTGFYLDETPLQKRAAGGFGSQNGTPVPPLFDLERVEVLRGPQGTLFGGGSEGGTVRYITPAPSLTEYSSYGRAQYLSTKGGDPGAEAGLAVGGPIVDDKLGFRASYFYRKTGGYIDLTDYRDGHVYDENANNGALRMGRAALAWQPTESTRLTVSWLKSSDRTDHLNSSYNLSEPGRVVVQPLCFNIPFILSLPPSARAYLFFPGVQPVNPGCNGSNGTYVAPGYTIGPFDLDRFQSLALGPTPTRTDLEISSADFEWQIKEGLTLKSVTSFTSDLSRGQSPQNFPLGQLAYPTGVATLVTPGLPDRAVTSGTTFNPNVTDVPNGLGLGALFETNTHNKRTALSQEVRLSYAPNETFNYILGAFFSNTRTGVRQIAEANNGGFVQFSGMSIAQRYGVPFEGFFSSIFEKTRDIENAVFADGTWHITDKLRANAGVRVSYVSQDFLQSNYGPNVGTSAAAQSQVTGHISETPVTPKFSLQYFHTPDDLIYATAAKGFRAGGVNQVLTSATSGFLFGLFGLTSAPFPRTYESDSVWNYELGAKFRLLNGKAQINTAVYQIDWKNPQVFAFTGDGAVVNADSARVRGAELEAQVRPIRALTLNAALAWTNAKYTSEINFGRGPTGTNDYVLVRDGQKFFQPAWTADLGARYDFRVSDTVNTYARVDYRWQEDYLTAAPGTAQYSPDSSKVPAQKNINLRLGADFRDFDVNLFVLNLTDEKTASVTGGRSGCTPNTNCATYTTYTYGRTVSAPLPRQIGVQVAYRLR